MGSLLLNTQRTLFVSFLVTIFTLSDSQIQYTEANLHNRRATPLSRIEPTQAKPPSHPVYDFARNLFLETTELNFNKEENVLISPFSIRAILGLTYLAANGRTAQEIRDALQFSSEPERLISGLGKHMQQTQAQAGQSFLFKVGNGIFIQEGAILNKTYSDIALNKLYSKVTNVDFRNTKKATREINDWVRRVTANKIPDLLPPSSLSPETSIFLGNALYFSGQWEKPFDGSVPEMESKFKLISGEEITTPMMQIESTFGYAYISALQSVGISIPFKDHRFEFIILKPDGSLRELENLMKTYPLNNLASDIKAYKRNVVLKMPKFKLDVNYDLVNVMRQLGINSLFDPSLVDLSGLTKGGEHHKVSRIIHRTSLDVNEDGATAAAASGVEIYPISSPSIFAVDKPFVFMINDRLTGPVLLGHLVNPLESSMTY